MGLLDSKFRIEERGSSVGQEFLGGVTTFMALSYIIFVQPAVMSAAGVPVAGAFVATCVASAIACVLMALLANYPIALAPAMGHNFFFALTVCAPVAVGGFGLTWQQALASVFVAGGVFVALSFFGFRAKIMEFIPDDLKRAIAGGIGLLIALVGLEYAGIIMGKPGTFVAFGEIKNRYTLLSIFGLAVTLILLARNVRGAVLYGIVVTTLAGLVLAGCGVQLLDLELKWPETHEAARSMFKLDFRGLLTMNGITVILTFLFLDVFDTVGTLVGVSERAGLLDEKGRLPRARWALFSDASGTVVGAVMGTSTITSYVESAAGVQAGARTGLANLVTAALFLLSLLLYPVLGVVATMHVHTTVTGMESHLYPILAPALIVVGSMMLKSLSKLKWDDPTEFLPAFLTVVVMPLTVSITEGIAFGFISYSLLKLVTGRAREAHWGFHVVSLVLILRYVFLV
jgi:AGZA family xanthine/uracil permease-like MFS transporter